MTSSIRKKTKFQFLLVRLRVGRKDVLQSRTEISIPSGAIKREIQELNWEKELLFQFLLVRLRAATISNLNADYPTFQFLLVRLRVFV